MVCHWKEDDYRIVVGGGACLGASPDIAKIEAGIDVQLKITTKESSRIASLDIAKIKAKIDAFENLFGIIMCVLWHGV